MPIGPNTIIVCDDDLQRAAKWQQDLQGVVRADSGFQFRALADGELTKAVEVLEARRAAARKHEAGPADCIFDSAAALIIDYDLLGFTTASFVTGETVA